MNEPTDIIYIITLQHPDNWEDGVSEEATFTDRQEAVDYFILQRYDEHEFDTFYLVETRLENPIDNWNVESIVDIVWEDSWLWEGHLDKFTEVATRHITSMVAELKEKKMYVYDPIEIIMQTKEKE